MDMSDPSSINSSDLDTMGNLLASSNGNNSQASETDQSARTTLDEPSAENVEVTECQNEKIPDISADVGATGNLSTQDIDMLIMAESSGSVTASTVDNLNVSESDDNVEDLWLAGETRELVKVETDEDFDVIVKSLETAIVETDRYDIGTDTGPDCPDTVVLASDSLLGGFSKDLVLPPPTLSEMAERGEQIMLSENVEMTDEITRELEVEAAKLQTAVSDNTDDQCLESLIDTTIITSEFATITDDIQETFDEQSTSLFEPTEAVAELTDNIDSRPSLLELQEADMTCDIAEEMSKGVLINDTLLNDEESVDSTEEILNNIASEAEIEEAIDEEVDEVMLEFPEPDSPSIDDENATEMLNKSIDMPLAEESVEMNPAEEQETEENRAEEMGEIISETSEEKGVELTETLTEEDDVKSEGNVGELTKTVTSDSECDEVLATDVEKVDRSEVNSDINIVAEEVEMVDKPEVNSDSVPEVNVENLTDIFDKTEVPVTSEINDQLDTTQDDVIVSEPEINSTETMMNDLETDMQETSNSVRIEPTESQTVVSAESEIKVETKLEQLQVDISETSIVEQAAVENQEQLSIAPENVRLEDVSVVLEECLDKVPVVLAESVDENKLAVTVEESGASSQVTLDENKLVEENITVSPDTPGRCTPIPEEIITTVSDISAVTTITDEQITESQVDERTSSATSDKPKCNEHSAHTSPASGESQSSVREDQAKQALETVEKEPSPPKKIKLIREKLYIPPVSVSTVLPPVNTSTHLTAEDVSSENVTGLNVSENIKLLNAKPVPQINDDVREPIGQEVTEKTSPVRSRKLKLKRNYEPEQVVTGPESEVIKSVDSVTTEQMSEQENIKPSACETNSDDLTVHCESQNIALVQEIKTEQDEIKVVSETTVTVDEATVPRTDTIELDVNLRVDKVLEDSEMITEPVSEHKSTEPVLIEVNMHSASEVSDTKQVEVPVGDSISNELPVPDAVDNVLTASDNSASISEDIPAECDVEKSAKSPDREETSVEIISKSPEHVLPAESPSPSPVRTSEVNITEETVAIREVKSSGTEESTRAAAERITLPLEPKPSILQQMLMKDIVVAVKQTTVVQQPGNIFAVEPIKECETILDRGANELRVAGDIERAPPDESTIEEELMQVAKEVETRIDEENDDELKEAAQEAEIRATMEANETEDSVRICEDEIIAVTQALEMERAQENLVEMGKTEPLLEICEEKPAVLDEERSITRVTPATGDQASLESTDPEEIHTKPTVEPAQLAKVEENRLKRRLEDAPSTSGVATKRSRSSKDQESAFSGRKLKSSPVTGDSVSIGGIDSVAAKQSVTIEPVTAPSGVESVGKLRISRRKLEESVLCKSVTITKPLRVEVDDLSMSPSYFSDLAPQRDAENVPKIVIKPIPKPEERSSPKITIKPIVRPSEMILSPKASKSKGSEDTCLPRITIKPIMKTDPLKITITKQKTDDTHSILKIYKADDFEERNIPRLTIKPVGKSGDEMQHSPRITIKPVKPPNPHSPSCSPKITVKPVVPPSAELAHHSPKVTVKPVVGHLEDTYPKVTIKPILRPDESPMSPRQLKLKTMMTFESSSGVTVEPIAQTVETQLSKISVKPFAKMEDTLSPKLTIKPITKTCEIVQSEDGTCNPLKLTIKPILKPEESYQSPKITIKPIMKVDQAAEELDKPPERIILKIQKTNLASPKERAASNKETRKEPEVKIEAILQDSCDRNQKLDKIKLKLTREGSHAQIIPSVPSMLSEQFALKRPLLFSDASIVAEKRSKGEFSGTELLHNSDISINLVEPNAKPNPKTISEEVTIVKLDRASSSGATPLAEHISQSKFKEMLLKIQQKADITCTRHLDRPDDGNSSSSDDVKIIGVGVLAGHPLKDPLSIHDESSSQDVVLVNDVINTNPFHNVQIINAHTITEVTQQTPKKRGRPRKNPLEVKPEIKGEDCVEIVRPKRTCRAPPGRTPFAVKERKPRGAGRARGGGRGRGGGARSPAKTPKEPKTPRGKALKEAKALAKLEAAKLAQEVVIDAITIEDSTNDTTPVATPVPPPAAPAEETPKKLGLEEQQEMLETEAAAAVVVVSEELVKEPPQLPPPPLAVYEEETRMSADNSSSRAQTPARQVLSTAPQLLEGPEESQSSVQSSATTESNKNKKGRLEVCDADSAVTGVEQIVEYTWGTGGTYMLQEQIAQFLGVKSFKRKYPGLTRRPVEMQERDYIREKGLVSESMCDMGLTAVPSSEVLDIMYTDFQEKYEEYRKYMRDKQSKEISNKQKAISLATSQEKNKIDFKERAVRSAANWNVNFNKTRKETRRCCMDLQTFTINFPLGRTQGRVPQKSPVGQYPIALVPGQFTDYYKRYTSNELHYLPLNTVRYGPVMPNQHCTDAGQSDGSQSDTDSSSGSDSDSSDDSMSTVEDTPATGFMGKPAVNVSTPKAKVH